MRNLAICFSNSRKFPLVNVTNAVYDVDTDDLYVVSEKEFTEDCVNAEVFKLDLRKDPEVSFMVFHILPVKLN